MIDRVPGTCSERTYAGECECGQCEAHGEVAVCLEAMRRHARLGHWHWHWPGLARSEILGNSDNSENTAMPFMVW